MHNMRHVISLTIEGGRKGQHMGGTKLDTEAARLAALNHYGDSSFCHASPRLGSVGALLEFECDYAVWYGQRDVMKVTGVSED
jgi:hypothetical protein